MANLCVLPSRCGTSRYEGVVGIAVIIRCRSTASVSHCQRATERIVGRSGRCNGGVQDARGGGVRECDTIGTTEGIIVGFDGVESARSRVLPDLLDAEAAKSVNCPKIVFGRAVGIES